MSKLSTPISKSDAQEWVREVCDEMSEWVSEIENDNEHLLILDLETIHLHSRRMAAQIYWVGSMVAYLKEQEELIDIEIEHVDGVIKTQATGSATAIKAAVAADPRYVKLRKELITVKTQRRCMEALLEAVMAKNRMMPGSQGAHNRTYGSGQY